MLKKKTAAGKDRIIVVVWMAKGASWVEYRSAKMRKSEVEEFKKTHKVVEVLG